MAIYIYTFLCTNGACRNIEKESGVKKAQIRCPKCGSSMRLIDTEKKWLLSEFNTKVVRRYFGETFHFEKARL